MEAIHDAVEELSEAREERHEGIRGVVTILLLAVTLLVAVTALLAGLASRQASLDQEGRSVHAAEAQRAAQHEAQLAPASATSGSRPWRRGCVPIWPPAQPRPRRRHGRRR